MKFVRTFSRACRWLAVYRRVFPRLATVTRFPALGNSYTFSCAWHRFHLFPRLAPAARFPALGNGYTLSHAWQQPDAPIPTLGTCCTFSALGNGYTLSRAWQQLHLFPRLAPVARFPALGIDCKVACACRWLPVRRRLVTCFPALSNGYTLSRAWQQLHLFPRLVPVACFPALGTGCKFSRS